MDKNSPLILSADELNELCYIKIPGALQLALILINGLFVRILKGERDSLPGLSRDFTETSGEKGIDVRSPQFYEDYKHFSKVIVSIGLRFPWLIR